MSNNSDIVFTPAARMAQAQRGSARAYEKRVAAGFPDRVTPELAGFIAELDAAFLGKFPPPARPLSSLAAGRRGSSKCSVRRRSGFPITAANARRPPVV